MPDAELLRQSGLRVTPQRLAILEEFAALPAGTHLSAEDLHARLVQQRSGISLATTYRTLNLLVRLGHLREHDFTEGHRHYEWVRHADPQHHHIVCVVCLRPVEFAEPAVGELAREVAERHGFALSAFEFEVRGVCATCQG